MRLHGRVGVFLCSHVDVVPTEFVRFIRYTFALPETVIFLTVLSLPIVRRRQLPLSRRLRSRWRRSHL